MTVEEQIKALSAKVDALSEGKPNEAMNKTIADAVTAAVNAAVKPLTDAHTAMVANQKAKDDAEHAELVTKIVNAKVLDEATAKATPLATLRALAPKADPKAAAALNAAFNGGAKANGFQPPKGE
jgi:uncharacterized protein YutE (UPF0331/DUF86 family)